MLFLTQQGAFCVLNIFKLKKIVKLSLTCVTICYNNPNDGYKCLVFTT